MLSDLHALEILNICEDRCLFIYEHEDNDIKSLLKIPLVFYDMHTHYIMDKEGEIIVSGTPLTIHEFLTREKTK